MKDRWGENRVCQLLGIDHPIIQGGMIYNSGAKLAAAVAEAGGLGLIGAGSMRPELFREQIRVFRKTLLLAPPDKDQQKDVDFLLSLGEIFSLIAYAHLILENAKIHQIEAELVNQLFDVLVRDFSRYALELHNKSGTSARQSKQALNMIRKPLDDPEQYDRVWMDYVQALNGAYVMNQ